MLNVAINAEVAGLGQNGGLESALIGLISALGRLEERDRRYTIIGPRDHPGWLQPYLAGNQELVFRPRYRSSLPARIKHRLQPSASPSPAVPPISSGFYESLGCDVIHFPYQHFEISSIPSVYTPHDLQHLHLPQFFSPQQIARREAMYRTACQLSKKVTVGSDWVRDDLLVNYSIDPKKVEVIPWAPPTEAYPEPTDEVISRVSTRLGLEGGFALYPAVTWPHKNHIRLLEAIALVRDRHGVVIDLVCTGSKTDYYSEIAATQKSLGLEEQVRFIGMIPGQELRALYKIAGFVVVPTLFEAVSGPMFEAWHDGTPVAASTVTSLPEQAGGAALLFDPSSVEAIAEAMLKMHRDDSLRKQLVARGKTRLESFTWERTASRYAAVYREVAGL